MRVLVSYYAFGQNDQMYSSRGGPSADLQSGTNYSIPPPGSSSSADESSGDESTSNEAGAPSSGGSSGGGAGPSQGPPEGGPDGGSAALLLPLTVLAALGIGLWVWTR